ncbi:lysine decarboxylase [Nitrospira sp.]|nr:lysine decarboxylase [Nitrospira sp.]
MEEFASVPPSLRAILQSSSYRRIEQDAGFLDRDEFRPIRLQLEYLKPEFTQREHDIRSTIVAFGSARLLDVEAAARQLELAPYYDHAREFERLVFSTYQVDGHYHDVIVTGGGPGIMEAANRGAADVGAKSIGFNITLRREQRPNPDNTPGLCFQSRYFALRKMHFMLRARALVAFPGGFGALDELVEVLTLVQTGKALGPTMSLFGRAFWEKLIDWDQLIDYGLIGPTDLGLIHFAESAEEAWDVIQADQRVKETQS